VERDDTWLVSALNNGEGAAVEVLVDRYGGWIYRVAARILNDRRDAEEVTQDVLMTVVRKIETFKREAALSSWIYRIAANAAYERMRGRGARTELSLDAVLPVFDAMGRHVEPVVDWSRELENPAVAAELRAALEGALARLPAEYRAVLVLRDVEGLDTREVAEALGLTVAALKSRLHRARLFVRKELADLLSPAR
jgi:RNA polymerase sigma-70 factor, ECF subfamily